MTGTDCAERTLVTGGTGSFRRTAVRMLLAGGCGEVRVFSRDELKQELMRQEFGDPRLRFHVGDVRDRDSMDAAMRGVDWVFHAAALKHLTLLERYPHEGFRTNALATLDLLEIAAGSGVERFVNVSTDKAADPTNVLGYTKRIAERLTAEVARGASGSFMSVRFGNVLRSRGSVLTAFRAQLERGGPLTVTDPEVSQYFMTVAEACQLVIQAGAIRGGGDALVLDMGEPVKIDDVPRRLAEQTSKPIEIVYTGLRPGEKLHEQLFGPGEYDHRPVHQLISHVAVSPVAAEAVRSLPSGGEGDMRARLADLACRDATGFVGDVAGSITVMSPAVGRRTS